jgi:Putative amidoligase enzyme
MMAGRNNGFEFELVPTTSPVFAGQTGSVRRRPLALHDRVFNRALPVIKRLIPNGNFSPIRSRRQVVSDYPLAQLFQNTGQGESGSAWNTLLYFVTTTVALQKYGALQKHGLKAGIYKGALDELLQLLGKNRPDTQELARNLQNSGLVIPGYQMDTFGIGFDSSTYALTPGNAAYYKKHKNIANDHFFDGFCGLEVNGPVSDSPFKTGRQSAAMVKALTAVGLATPASCGIHQHIEILDFTHRDLANLYRIMMHWDAAWREHILPPHRRDSRFCRPLDYHVSPPEGITPQVFVCRRLERLCREYDEYAETGISREVLLKSFAYEVQANIYPSGNFNSVYYGIIDDILLKRLDKNLEERILQMRQQRYFILSPESPYKKGTIEFRPAPATADVDYTQAGYFLNYVAVEGIKHCAGSKIMYDATTGQHKILIDDRRTGKTLEFDNSFAHCMNYLQPDSRDFRPQELYDQLAFDLPQEWMDLDEAFEQIFAMGQPDDKSAQYLLKILQNNQGTPLYSVLSTALEETQYLSKFRGESLLQILARSNDPALWGNDPALEDPLDRTGNMGLCSQAPVPTASRWESDPAYDPALAAERAAINALTEQAMLGEAAFKQWGDPEAQATLAALRNDPEPEILTALWSDPEAQAALAALQQAQTVRS